VEFLSSRYVWYQVAEFANFAHLSCQVTFELDTDSILRVTAIEKSLGTTEKITITNDTGRPNKDQIDKMVSEAQRFEAEDREHIERIKAKNSLEVCFAS